jgi:hypothetical protein
LAVMWVITKCVNKRSADHSSVSPGLVPH